MKTIKAGIFIIPNSLCKLESYVKFNKNYVKQISGIFPEWRPEENEKLVEVWVHDFDEENENYCDNWSCHYKRIPGWDDKIMKDLKAAKEAGDEELIDSLLELKHSQYWPTYLPVSVVKSLKEGETIECQFKGAKIELQGNQLKTRYRSFGKFENVLEKLIAIYQD